MNRLAQSSMSNRLLAQLDIAEFSLIEPHLEKIEMQVRFELYSANTSIEYVYFLDSGVASVVALSHDGQRIEVGVTGREGFCGMTTLLGSDQSPHKCLMQVDGDGYRIKTTDFIYATEESATLRHLLLRYVHVFITQTAQTALANGSAKIDQRLARWLLMFQDRIDGAELHLTHQFLSMMLCVRRSSVTDTIHILEGRGLIKAERGKITIRDREKLLKLAGASYGQSEAEYARLFGAM